MAIRKGTNGDDVLSGTSGADTIYGFDGDDRLSGRDGNDLLLGGEGSDRLDGGAGVDLASWENTRGGVRVDLSTGRAESLVNPDEIDWLIGIERVRGSTEMDNLEGSAGANTLYGLDGDDVIQGGGGNDSLYGDLGDDYVDGEAGADRVEGGAGRDLVSGGVGNDLIRGNDGDDRLAGDEFGAPVEGQIGGADRLYGGNGNDSLAGDAGRDLLYGGSGADTFIYTHGIGDEDSNEFNGGQEILMDFVKGADKIAIEYIDYADFVPQGFADFDTNGNGTLDNGDQDVTIGRVSVNGVAKLSTVIEVEEWGNEGDGTVTVHGVTGLRAGDFLY